MKKDNVFIAPFPDKVTQAVQYGNGIKAHIVYLSQYQLLPYNRIQEYFADQLGMPISEGSIYNFDKQAYEQLAEFETISKEHLVESPCIHADETGININGKRHWLHGTSNDQWTHFFPPVSGELMFSVYCKLSYYETDPSFISIILGSFYTCFFNCLACCIITQSVISQNHPVFHLQNPIHPLS